MGTISIISPRTFKIITPSFIRSIFRIEKIFFNIHFDLEHVPITLVIIGLLCGNVTTRDLKRGILGIILYI